jgi:secreted PhoX family phosphatase
MLDLPRGFQYRVISREGSRLSNGAPVPGDHDGMAALKGPERGTTTLVRNHEQCVGDPNPVAGENPYDPASPGGTTAVVVDNDSRRVVRSYVSSSGTLNNCAGGATPWGTWLTCEEDRTTNHGYVFEVDPRDPENALSKSYSDARQRQMGVAAPPRSLAPNVSGGLAEAAGRHGMGTLEAAAYDRLGVALV